MKPKALDLAYGKCSTNVSYHYYGEWAAQAESSPKTFPLGRIPSKEPTMPIMFRQVWSSMIYCFITVGYLYFKLPLLLCLTIPKLTFKPPFYLTNGTFLLKKQYLFTTKYLENTDKEKKPIVLTLRDNHCKYYSVDLFNVLTYTYVYQSCIILFFYLLFT